VTVPSRQTGSTRRRVRTRLLLPAAVVGLCLIGLAVARAWDRSRAESRVQQAQAMQLVKVAARTLDGTIAESQTLLLSISKLLDPTAAPEHNDVVLQELFRAAPVRYANIWISDTAGNNIGAARLPPAGRAAFSIADRLYFKKVKQTRKFVVGDVVKSRVLPGNPLVLSFVLPILSDDSSVVRAVLGASLQVDSLEAVRAVRSLPSGSVLTVLDSSGTVILRSADAANWIGRAISEEETRRNFRKGEGVGEGRSADGTVRLASFKGLERIPWMAYIGIPAQYTIDVVKYQFLRDLLTGVLVTLLFLALGYKLAMRVVTPIESLTADARAIADGDMTRRSTITTDDEVGDLATAFNRMADTVVERNEALRASQEQLLHAQKMDALGSFAGGIAHDFNNYLSAIVGHAELAEMSLESNEQARADIQEILATSARAADLTRQILVFSRRQVVEPRVLDINAVLRGIDRMLNRVAGEARALTVTLNPLPLLVLADHGQLEQVIVNLVTNARDATDDGGTIRISTSLVPLTTVDTATGRVSTVQHARLTVTDNGAGMSPQIRDRIFDPFFTTKDRGHGTGLGLAIAYGIVQQSGGSIAVESTVGFGSTFTVTLPIRPATPTTVLTVTNVATAEPVRGGRILVAEDDDAVRTSTGRMLERAGYTVVLAADGVIALQLLQDSVEPFDLLLSDVVMPGMSGSVLVGHARRLKPEMAVLFMSGYADDQAVQNELAADTVACLPKPFTSSELTAFVSRAMASRPAISRSR
jgi:signal transduction histidine kinase/ActR/RegA family two-component response regulator